MKSLREVLEAQPGQDEDLPPNVGTFLRGLSLGALVGAAIAGSVLLQRRRHRDVPQPRPEDGPTDDAGS